MPISCCRRNGESGFLILTVECSSFQEGAAAEIAEKIAEFVSSLPKTERGSVEEMASRSGVEASRGDFDDQADFFHDLPGPHGFNEGWGF